MRFFGALGLALVVGCFTDTGAVPTDDDATGSGSTSGTSATGSDSTSGTSTSAGSATTDTTGSTGEATLSGETTTAMGSTGDVQPETGLYYGHDGTLGRIVLAEDGSVDQEVAVCADVPRPEGTQVTGLAFVGDQLYATFAMDGAEVVLAQLEACGCGSTELGPVAGVGGAVSLSTGADGSLLLLNTLGNELRRFSAPPSLDTIVAAEFGDGWPSGGFAWSADAPFAWRASPSVLTIFAPGDYSTFDTQVVSYDPNTVALEYDPDSDTLYGCGIGDGSPMLGRINVDDGTFEDAQLLNRNCSSLALAPATLDCP